MYFFQLNKLINDISPPSQGNQLCALPAPSTPLQRAPSLESLPSYEDGIPPLASHIKTPEVLWYQDNYMIGIKINLPGVEQYHLEWDAKHFKFRYTTSSLHLQASYISPASPGLFSFSFMSWTDKKC